MRYHYPWLINCKVIFIDVPSIIAVSHLPSNPFRAPRLPCNILTNREIRRRIRCIIGSHTGTCVRIAYVCGLCGGVVVQAGLTAVGKMFDKVCGNAFKHGYMHMYVHVQAASGTFGLSPQSALSAVPSQ